MGQGGKPSILSRVLYGWHLAISCRLLGRHAYGEAADVGLPPGIVCYCCGDRLHFCNGQLQARLPPDRDIPAFFWIAAIALCAAAVGAFLLSLRSTMGVAL